MFDQMKKLMDMKKQAERIKKELDATTVDVEEVSGIKIVMTGSQKFCSIEIDEKHLNTNSGKKLESDLLLSLNKVMKKSQGVAADKMKAMAGLNLPGLS